MLVIKKGNTKDLQLSGFPVAGNLQSQPVKNGTGPSVYKGLVPKPAVPPTKPTQWKSQAKENKVGTSFPHESTYGIGNFNTFKSTAKNISPSTNSVKECNCSNSFSPVDKLNQQPRLTKLTRMRSDKKSEFLKALKRDRVEEEHEDESHAGSEKDDDSFNLHNSNSTHQERDIARGCWDPWPCPGAGREAAGGEQEDLGGARGQHGWSCGSGMGNSISSFWGKSAATPVNQIQETISNNCVVIFSKTSCSYCSMAKKIFHDMNVNYKVVELDMLEHGNQFQDALYKMTGERTVPRIFVNGRFIGGAADTHRLHKEGKLLPLVHQCYFKKSKRKDVE